MLESVLLSPLRRGLFEPLLHLKNGSRLRPYWKELEETQYLPEAVLRQRQWDRLQQLLGFVWEHNDFYRCRMEGAGMAPGHITSPADLQRLPVLRKEEIRASTERMISRGYALSALKHFQTGGSTGRSLDIYVTEECSELRNACARRHDRWSGWEVGDPVAAVWGNPHLPHTLKEKLRHWLIAPYIYLDTMNVTAEAVQSFALQWRRVRPTLLFGHAHSIYLLARYLRELGETGITPRGIISTSMMLLPHERQVIEEVFQVKVTDRYGCEEVSLIGCECQYHQGLHLNIEHLYIEFLGEDGTPVRPGEAGRIVVTDLMNRAMPFIRYQVEDVGVPSERSCPCGRGLPLMERVSGRLADFLIRRDGSRVAGISLIENTLTRIAGIDQMQVVQESLDSIRLRVVPGRGYGTQSRDELVRYFAQTFQGTQVQVETAEAIPAEASGKYRFSICKIAP